MSSDPKKTRKFEKHAHPNKKKNLGSNWYQGTDASPSTSGVSTNPTERQNQNDKKEEVEEGKFVCDPVFRSNIFRVSPRIWHRHLSGEVFDFIEEILGKKSFELTVETTGYRSKNRVN